MKTSSYSDFYMLNVENKLYPLKRILECSINFIINERQYNK